MRIFFFLLLTTLSLAETLPERSFSSSKDKLTEKIYPDHQISIYCGCTYDRVPLSSSEEDYAKELHEAKEKYLLYNWDSLEGFFFPSYQEWKEKMQDRFTLVPDHESCGFKPKGSGYRAGRIEWEHAMPASLFGRTFKAWTEGDEACVSPYREQRVCKRDGDGAIHCETVIHEPKPYKGRRCARKVSKEFARMEEDMHNLYPAIGDVNGYRGDLPFGMVAGEKREFGKCDFELGPDAAEPAPSVRGEMARTWFYMKNRYPESVVLSEDTMKMLESWSHSDPVDTWECERHDKILALQGDPNPWLVDQCQDLRQRSSRFDSLHQDPQ